MSKEPLFLEEAVLDDLAQGFNRLEMPLSEKAFRLVGGAALLITLVVFGRIIFLAGFKGAFYKERAMVNAGQIDITRAERGIVFDRFGKPLVKNIPSFRLSLRLVDFFKTGDERNKTLEDVSGILGIDINKIKEEIADSDMERQNSIVIDQSLGVEQIIKIKDLNSPFLTIENDYKREYENGPVFSHLVGYTGSASKSDLKEKKKDAAFSFNDIVGKTGLEYFYDEELRGKDGQILNYRNAKGEIIDEKILNNPESGNRLFSFIDADLQKFFYEKLRAKLLELGNRGGVGIAMNPDNGEVLAIINLPSFDNNRITTGDLSDDERPLFNRAIAGNYTPGSTIKPLHAFAALEEGIVSPDSKIFSAGYIEVPNPYYPDKPYRFPDWKPHGWVDVYSALARSSNVYFYEVGGGFEDLKGLGIDRLKEYWKKFRLGEKTGIDLPSEASGFLPDPETKKKTPDGAWRIGDTYNVSIGQGDLMVTPIQLLNYICAFANGGKIMEPRVMNKIVAENDTAVKENPPKIVADLSSRINSINTVRQGMTDTVEKEYGTAHTLADLPVSVAGKTGSSQVENKTKINAFFVGYAPKDDPKIAVLVLIEDAREGSLNAVPVAGDVFEWYYNNRLKN